MAEMLDPARIATFFALPGAVQLVEAFSSIPPGPLRDSIVSHARALADHAEAIDWNHPRQNLHSQPPPMPSLEPQRPQLALGNGATKSDEDKRKKHHRSKPDRKLVVRDGVEGWLTTIAAHDQRTAKGKLYHVKESEAFRPLNQTQFRKGQTPSLLHAVSDEGRIIERVLRGETPAVVAADVGVDVEFVLMLMRRARKDGVMFPGDDKGLNVSQASPMMQKVRARARTPKPPYWWEDPDSPIWNNDALLPSGRTGPTKTLGNVGPMDQGTFRIMTAAASKQGRTLRNYVRERAEVLRRAKAGERPGDIAEAVGIPAFTVYGILDQCGYNATTAAKEHGRPTLQWSPR